ncbi:hypothetical protein FACS18947_7130 [Bacteroidia bacterium]|nr:hypothetical protein FACS18947_7130 [Bacteroidia bacterium]
MLADGIGDTIRVSLTGDPLEEIAAANDVLASLGMLPGEVDIISCPTCGRCKVDLASYVKKVRNALAPIEKARIENARQGSMGSSGALTVAIMGCVVNGPGEASHADIGVAFAGSDALLFKKGGDTKKIRENEVVAELIKAAKAAF